MASHYYRMIVVLMMGYIMKAIELSQPVFTERLLLKRANTLGEDEVLSGHCQ